MTRFRSVSRHIRRSMFALGATCVSTACTSNQTTINNVNCGAGTHLEDGACVPDDGDASVDTSSSSDSLVESETTDSPHAEIGVSDSVSADTHKSLDSTADSTIDSVSDESDSGPSDPCPPKIDINCATDCGGPTVDCASYTCNDAPGPPPILIGAYSEFPVTLRTPDHPGVDPNCQPRCGTDNTVYGIAIRVALPYGTGTNAVRIRVGPPWTINRFSEYAPYCMNPAIAGTPDCYKAATATGEWFVGTKDPDAPARNIYVDLAPAGGTCE